MIFYFKEKKQDFGAYAKKLSHAYLRKKKKKKPAFLSITHISTILANYTEALLL